MGRKHLTVEELIRLLEKQGQTRFVSVEGCDCYQDAGGVEAVEDPFDGEYVLITKVGLHHD